MYIPQLKYEYFYQLHLKITFLKHTYSYLYIDVHVQQEFSTQHEHLSTYKL